MTNSKNIYHHRYQGIGLRKASVGTITSSLWSSASLLTIPYIYFRNLDEYAIEKAKAVIKNANYMKDKLSGFYKLQLEKWHTNLL